MPREVSYFVQAIHVGLTRHFAKEGIDVCEASALLFTGLKLTGYIGWAWWAVLLPLYASFFLTVALACTAKAIATWMDRLAQVRSEP